MCFVFTWKAHNFGSIKVKWIDGVKEQQATQGQKQLVVDHCDPTCDLITSNPIKFSQENTAENPLPLGVTGSWKSL